MGFVQDELERKTAELFDLQDRHSEVVLQKSVLEDDLKSAHVALDMARDEQDRLAKEVDRLRGENSILADALHAAKYPKDGKEVARMVSCYCNSYNTSHKAFVDQMSEEHKTLQQSFMRLIWQTIEAFAKEGYYDGRNEATVLLCRRIVEKCGDDSYLPFV